MNKTAAKRLGYDCMDIERPDLTESFSLAGEKAEAEKPFKPIKVEALSVEDFLAKLRNIA